MPSSGATDAMPAAAPLPADGCVRVPLDELAAPGATIVDAGRQRIVVCRLGESLFAVGGVCPHRGGPIADGDLIGAVLRCPWHGASFDVRTGERVRGPECRALKSFAVTEEGDELVIAVRPPWEWDEAAGS